MKHTNISLMYIRNNMFITVTIIFLSHFKLYFSQILILCVVMILIHNFMTFQIKLSSIFKRCAFV